MATLPNPYGDRVVPRSARPRSQLSEGAFQQTGQAVSQLGQNIADAGAQVQRMEDTAIAKERDAYVSDQIRKILYDPEAGFSNRYGRDAVDGRKSALEQIEKLRDMSMGGMSNSAKRAFDAGLNRRIEGAKGTIDRHTATQRNEWLNGASAARIEAAQQDSLLTGDITSSFAVISGELTERADREGWDSAKLDLELSKAKSGLHYNNVMAIANNNPEMALEYVNKHSESLLPSDALKLKSSLEPLAKAFKGRRIGAEAALIGVSRNYLSAIRSAESGGNDAAKNPRSTATGRYQFTSGTWAAVAARHPNLGLTPEGRLDPLQQERAIRAFTADNAKVLSGAGIQATGGNLYAAHFLGAGGAIKVLQSNGGMAMADVVGPGVVAANPFLAGMTVDSFKRWANSKGGGESLAFSDNATADIDAIIDIEDPDVRKAALEEFELRNSVAAGHAKKRLSEASNVAFQHIEAGNDPAELPLDVRQSLGMENMSKLRTYYGKIASGEKVETDSETYVMLRQMQVNDPSGFSDMNMLEYVNDLSPSDFKAFVDEQAAGVSPEKGRAASTLMSTAKRQMEAAGIDTTPKPGKAESLQVAAMQTRLLKWQNDFMKENGRQPTELEIDERIGLELVPVVTGGSDWNPLNNDEGFVFDGSDVEVSDLVDNGLEIGGVEIPAAVIEEELAAMQSEGVAVTSTALIQRIAELMEGL